MKAGHTKQKAWARTANIMAAHGDGVSMFTAADLVKYKFVPDIKTAKSQIHMFARRGMLKVVAKDGKEAVYKITHKKFRNETRHAYLTRKTPTVIAGNRKRDGSGLPKSLMERRVPKLDSTGEIFVTVTSNKLSIDAPGMILELTGKIHLKLDT